MRSLVALVAGCVLLAGCSNDPAGGTDSGDEDLDYGVKATDTTGVIRGLVYDETITPITGVLVVVASTAMNATTGDNGEFGFDGLDPGTYFLQATKAGFTSVQASVEVVAGEDAPPIVKIPLTAIPSQQPYVETHVFTGYLSFGAAVGLTSVGTTVYAPLADALGDRSIWYLTFSQLPLWAQGELVWDQTQPAGGEFIWEMTDTSNRPAGYRETTSSPALAYWNTTVIQENNETTLDPERGIAYRFFGGPHPSAKPGDTCPSIPNVGNPCYFGYGLTVQQKAEAYIHNFYNFVPAEGWRFTEDGDPVIPD